MPGVLVTIIITTTTTTTTTTSVCPPVLVLSIKGTDNSAARGSAGSAASATSGAPSSSHPCPRSGCFSGRSAWATFTLIVLANADLLISCRHTLPSHRTWLPPYLIMSWLDPLLPAMLRPLYKDIGDDLREHPPAHVTPTQQNKLAAVKRAEAAAKGKAVAQKASAKGKAGLIPFGIGHFTSFSECYTLRCVRYTSSRRTPGLANMGRY